jgi:hypothetical protein
MNKDNKYYFITENNKYKFKTEIEMIDLKNNSILIEKDFVILHNENEIINYNTYIKDSKKILFSIISEIKNIFIKSFKF